MKTYLGLRLGRARATAQFFLSVCELQARKKMAVELTNSLIQKSYNGKLLLEMVLWRNLATGTKAAKSTFFPRAADVSLNEEVGADGIVVNRGRGGRGRVEFQGLASPTWDWQGFVQSIHYQDVLSHLHLHGSRVDGIRRRSLR